MKPNLSHVIFVVTDVKASVELYKKAFGLETKFFIEPWVYAEFETGMTCLALAQSDFSFPNIFELSEVPPRAEWATSSITFEVENIEEAYQKALDAGATSVIAPKDMPWARVAYVKDFDGNIIEFSKMNPNLCCG